MKLLVAVKSCKHHLMAGYHDAILRTWGKDIPEGTDLRFFTGSCWMFSAAPEEVTLQVPDDYMSLPYKTKAICDWSVQHGYDYAFLCDTDTFLIPSRLLESDFAGYDYAGRFGAMPKIGTTFNYKDACGIYPNCHPWASGGVGYFLSKKAAELVAQVKPHVWAEDMFVGQVLGPHIQSGEIKAYDIPEFECSVAWHFPRRAYGNKVYDPKLGWMEKMYAEYK